MSEVASTKRKPMRKSDLISLDTVRTRLATVWLTGGSLAFIIVVAQSLMGRFGDQTQEAWGWLLPTIMPTLGMIVSVLGYAALDPLFSSSVVRKSFFLLSMWLSGFYLFLVLLTILVQPFTGRSPIELMQTSNLWLGPFQGLVASALGVLFVSKQATSGSAIATSTVEP
jgi:hypothetical protein